MDAELKTYLARWQAVEEIERQELQNATLELRWQQLNAIIGLAIELDIYESRGEDEVEVIQRWVKLKERATNQHTTT
jgi:hypothetical protein